MPPIPTRNKVAIIALDGASPKLIKEWADQGTLPHLNNMIKNGAFGELQSVVPPVTGAAWGSFISGINPGRHCIFEWLRRGENTYKLNLVDSGALPVSSLFEWIRST